MKAESKNETKIKMENKVNNKFKLLDFPIEKQDSEGCASMILVKDKVKLQSKQKYNPHNA